MEYVFYVAYSLRLICYMLLTYCHHNVSGLDETINQSQVEYKKRCQPTYKTVPMMSHFVNKIHPKEH